MGILFICKLYIWYWSSLKTWVSIARVGGIPIFLFLNKVPIETFATVFYNIYSRKKQSVPMKL